MAGERLYAFSGHMLSGGIFYRGDFFFWYLKVQKHKSAYSSVTPALEQASSVAASQIEDCTSPMCAFSSIIMHRRD